MKMVNFHLRTCSKSLPLERLSIQHFQNQQRSRIKTYGEQRKFENNAQASVIARDRRKVLRNQSQMEFMYEFFVRMVRLALRVAHLCLFVLLFFSSANASNFSDSTNNSGQENSTKNSVKNPAKISVLTKKKSNLANQNEGSKANQINQNQDLKLKKIKKTQKNKKLEKSAIAQDSVSKTVPIKVNQSTKTENYQKITTKKLISENLEVSEIPKKSEKSSRYNLKDSSSDLSKIESPPSEAKKSDKNNSLNFPKPQTQNSASEHTESEQVANLKQNNSQQKLPQKMSQKLWQKFNADDANLLKKITAAIQQKRFDEAISWSKELSDEGDDSTRVSLKKAILDIIRWNKFSNKGDLRKISFNDISSFAIDNPYLPNLKDIRRNAEAVAIANSVSFEASERYFATYPPLDSESKLFVIESKIESITNNKKPDKNLDNARRNLRSEIAKLWIKENFFEDEEREFLEKYGKILTEEDHIQRIERLIWDNRNKDAIRIFEMINSDHRKLFDSVIKIGEFPRYIDNLIISIPRKLRSNELLIHRVISWHKSKDNFEQLIDLLSNLHGNSKYPEKWWSYRRLYGREMLKRKDFKTAYKIISRHNLPVSSSDFWEAEWTSGWIALRFTKDEELALRHFSKLQENVSQPVTLSRSAYWLGMTYQKIGDKNKAIEWFKKAALYPTFFYGQLAIHKHRQIDPLNASSDIILPKDPDISIRDIFNISNSRAAQVAYILALTGDKENSSKIFEWIIMNSPTNGQISVVMKIINELGDRQLDARISRVAARKNVFFIRDKFQIIEEVSKDKFAPLVHAIIKQESNFIPSALSKVGAIGFMQLMPETAKLVAKEMGMKYDRKKLATDINYNVILGSFYIKKLLAQFENSEILAISSYNAGPNATQRWINEFYDPRKEEDHDRIVDWIELITYAETRNYVQRIIENLIVYKYLMSRSNYDDLS